MRRSKFNAPKMVLIFDTNKILMGIAGSLHNAADMTRGNLQAISANCTGKKISSAGLYFRYFSPDIEIERGDFGSLNLEEYDKMCGQTRTYHSKATMLKKKEKYKISINKKRKPDEK